MKKKLQLNKLSSEVINQIAAGEVIERPSSIVKELVDNSIDAGASKIVIRIRDGGMSLIEVSDNGGGIPKENLSDIFLAHTTTKLANMDDLNTLLSMGFRGEALSTIVAVSKVSVTSKYDGEKVGNKISFTSDSESKVSSTPRESGTVVKVEDIFENIPVRKKYLKTVQTEYRHIVDILTPYFLIYPNIHFELFKNDKQVINLLSKEVNSGILDKDRVKEVLKQDFVDRMEKVFFEGNGIKVSGLTAHPSDHKKRTKFQHIFVNGRSVWDNGIARAVIQGYERYIPHGEKIPFIITININPELVDVNIHPRKEEVKFLNPYRVFSAVEQAVSKALEKLVSYKDVGKKNVGDSKAQYIPDFTRKSKDYASSKNITFSKRGSVSDSLKFSEAILKESKPLGASDIGIQTSFLKPEKEVGEYKAKEVVSFYQIFKKYVIVEFENEIWIVDQHAAAERVTFEKLSKSVEIKNTDIQNLLVPTEMGITHSDIEFLKEYKKMVNNLGFDIEIKKGRLSIKSIPVEFVHADIEKLFNDIFDMDIEDSKKNLDRLKMDMVATMACHTSIRAGQRLDIPLMKDVYYNLLDCDNPYSCPHGRPIVWRMSIEEIDSKFDRTY
ncbi:DNA mismatch repair endonuclease MutL [bacterium]|nr:DNA mismatch repair endonuclease MutL [bacterium]